jgi:peptide/nickel transport system permease protein
MNLTSSPAERLNHQGPITHSGRPLLRLISGLYSHPASAIGTTLCIVFLLLALFGPHIAPYDANEQIVAAARTAPSSAHWFGTDNLGRDVFSRIVLGAREVLFLAGSGTLLAVLTGTGIGLLSGYWGGWFDEIIMRLFDSLLAIPALLLALLLIGVLGPSDNRAVLVILLVYTPIVARVVRSVVLGIKNRAFVEAARLQGESLGRILFREILPSVLPVLAVEAALRFSYAIFLVASLGFLGVGVQPPSPNWGLMVKEARTYATQLPWSLYFPAITISLLVIGVNMMADGLRRELLISEQEVV